MLSGKCARYEPQPTVTLRYSALIPSASRIIKGTATQPSKDVFAGSNPNNTLTLKSTALITVPVISIKSEILVKNILH